MQELADAVADYMNPLSTLETLGIRAIGHVFGAGQGEIHCDEARASTEETFIMFSRGEKRVSAMWTMWNFMRQQTIFGFNFPAGPPPPEFYDAIIVHILSFNGYFTADGDDKLVYANRKVVARDEEFELIHNGDGTVSFSSWLGYMSADRDRPNKRVSVDRLTIGPWERWKIIPQGNGRIALQESEGNFASVAA